MNPLGKLQKHYSLISCYIVNYGSTVHVCLNKISHVLLWFMFAAAFHAHCCTYMHETSYEALLRKEPSMKCLKICVVLLIEAKFQSSKTRENCLHLLSTYAAVSFLFGVHLFLLYICFRNVVHSLCKSCSIDKNRQMAQLAKQTKCNRKHLCKFTNYCTLVFTCSDTVYTVAAHIHHSFI